MTGEFVSIQGPVRFESPGSGHVQIGADAEVYALGELPWPPDGIGLGPLVLGTQLGESVRIDRLEYLPSEGGLGGLLPVAALPAMLVPAAVADGDADTNDTTATRRDVLKLAGGLGAGLALAGTARGADGEYPIAEFDVAASPGGLQVRVLDVVEDVLPPGREFAVSVNGRSTATFDPHVTDRAVLPSGTTGTVRVTATASLSSVRSLLASVGSILNRSDALEYQFEVGESVASLPAETEVVITSQAMVTDPVAEHAPGATAVSIGGVPIPHRSERATARGEYFTRETDGGDGRELVYRVGAEAPDAVGVTVRADIGRLAEARDDASRLWD